MPFIPHTEADVQSMLKAIGAKDIHALFDEVPAHLCVENIDKVPSGAKEYDLSREMQALANKDASYQCFIGAGAYEHFIPAAVWELVGRGEYMTAYTPYQAEASQGTLQLIYEYQTMMASLMDMEISNASLYDGATAVAEAILMAVRANKRSKSKHVLVASTLNPLYRDVVKTIVSNQGLTLSEIAYDPSLGTLDTAQLNTFEGQDLAAVVIPQPNFFGCLEAVDELTDWAHAQAALAIAVVNPLAVTLVKPPGQWGETGADIACGEGQPLGIPLASGGPYFGFMCTKKTYVRQMPGRIIGRTVDTDGKRGFALTLQAREQHIRRSKATSNICTNQGLMVTAATIHMSMLGYQGLLNVAKQSHLNTKQLLDSVCQVDGVERVFAQPFFHEQVLRLPQPADRVLEALTAQGILGGLNISQWYPELENTILVCATETKSDADIEQFHAALAKTLATN